MTCRDFDDLFLLQDKPFDWLIRACISQAAYEEYRSESQKDAVEKEEILVKLLQNFEDTEVCTAPLVF